MANSDGAGGAAQVQSGGQVNNGGSAAAPAGGAKASTGGSPVTNTSGGESVTTGGRVNAAGGRAETGGSSSLFPTTGGRTTTGGTTSTSIGTKATGGAVAATGGIPSTGGMSAALGGKAAGGTSGNGGFTSTGGATLAGGAGGATWPQCFQNDTVPTTALKQRATVSDYTTQVAYGGIAMIIGQNRQACLTDTVVNFDVQDLNQEIKDVVETVKFFGFLDWKRGYYMNWVILNSGIPNATISGQGGHQGDRYGHMNFESSEECPCNWGTGDDSNRGSALHESIHALQAELWAFNNQASGWIHEAHNCYTATMRAMMVENKYSEGWGTALTLQMPHGPIESMGMNTDGTWAGPADQNAKTYVNSINRYGLEIFWLVVNLEMGQGFIDCVWQQASNAGKPDNRVSGALSVFQAMQKASSSDAVAHVIQNFGARSAILDFAGWTSAMRTNMQGNWNNSYWFYTYPSGDGTTTFRPPTANIPHHQGRNVIPIKVNAGATSVTVEFTPDAKGDKGTVENMQAQLVYRDSADKPVYGTVFSSEQNTIQIPNGARNGIVNFVVAVTNLNGTGAGDDGSGKGFDAQEHFSYQARIISGGVVAPTTTRPW